MTRSNAPKPAEQRVREGGTPGKGTVSHRPVPQPVVLGPRVGADIATDEQGGLVQKPPKAPSDFPPEAVELWESAIQFLIDCNAAQLIDEPALHMLCLTYCRWVRVRKVVDEQGYFSRGSMGQMIVSPAVTLEGQLQDRFFRQAEQFGMTTLARTRLGLLEVARRSIQQEMDWTLGPSPRRRAGAKEEKLEPKPKARKRA